MSTTGCFVTRCGLAMLLIFPAALPAQTLREDAKRGFVERRLTNEYEPVPFSQLVSAADTIVIGNITAARSRLINGENDLVTDHDVVVARVLKRQGGPGLAKGDVLVVRRSGGVIELEGRTVTVTEEDFPQLPFPGTYVLFLKPVPNSQHYVPAHGPVGLFRVDADRIRQVSETFGRWNAERGTTTALESFVNEIQDQVRTSK